MTQMSALHETRLDTVLTTLKATGARSVLDLGCGSGSLLLRLLGEPQFERITGLEQSGASLGQARQMLAGLPGAERVRLILGSYLEPDQTSGLTGFDIAVMLETIEHVRPGQLSLAERTVFGCYRPGQVLMTTPNREYNPLFDLAPGERREPDHKFEWCRERFRQWARGVAQRQGYQVAFGGIGEQHPDFGQPTQTALFERL
ncbi:MAG: methyltransferase domain-containing protein [Marinobacter sp.]|uniref:methyltransferase n=1 Tax=Marinobacter sp. TaxID=50741 RepID=UPI00299DF7EA|nr:methyltransferase [Marinobacter sp.]MDX1633350.1 methyltransferase domain-containing protein [Marinobacter sp.]